MIKKEDIDRIFEAARIEEVVGDYVTLKKRGVNLIGNCPFHNEKTPSFYVSPSKGIYKCFGCGKGGHTVNFIMEHDKLSYPDALRYLAKKYNIQIVEKELTPEEQQTQNDRESLYVVSSFAQKHFSENLYNTDEGKSIGLGYFKERGIREDIVEKFQLGYSINQRTAFTDIAIATGYKLDYLVKAGLTIEYKAHPSPPEGREDQPTSQKDGLAGNSSPLGRSEGASYLDRFWGRVMFPIHNISGRVIGFGGRTLRTDKKTAKYINSPETEIYHKSNVLYGLYFAKAAIEKEKNCLLVEGYMDVISLHQAGIHNVVASSGTSLPAEQIRLIKRFSDNVTILYDGDEAGIKASFKGIDLILEEGMNVKVLLFPEGDDPDSFSKRVSNEELKTFIQTNSKDFIRFKTDLLMSKVQNDPIAKASLIKEIVETIALIPEAIYRSVYVKECSRIMAIEEQILLTELNKIRSKKFNDKLKRNINEKENENVYSEDIIIIEEKREFAHTAIYQENEIIRLLINYGTKDAIVYTEETDEAGNEIEIPVSVAELLIHELQHDNIVFEKSACQIIFDDFVQYLEKNIIPPQNYFINHSNIEVASLTVNYLTSPYVLADWKRHGIHVPLEEDNLKKSILSAIYSIKIAKLAVMKHNVQLELKGGLPEKEERELLTTFIQLLRTNVVLAKYLTRIIVN
ncbi:MAG: DNA primase [Bacteroidota bacterium]